MIELVLCTEKYWEFVRNLRNDQRVVSAFIDQIFITSDMQQIYMALNHINYRVALYNNEPAGYIGVIDGDIRICTHPDYQRLGIGKFMLNEIKSIWPGSSARIKVGNQASLELFRSCGYEITYFVLNQP